MFRDRLGRLVQVPAMAPILCILLIVPFTEGFTLGWGSLVRSPRGCSAQTLWNPERNALAFPQRRAYAGTSRQLRDPTKINASQTEYQTFFNNASKLGEPFISKLTPEERAQRAIEVS